MRAATAALLDQADAAGADAARIMRLISMLDGAPVQRRVPGPVYTALVCRMRQRGMAGQLTLCPHLSYTAPEPAFWCAWAPGRLRCAECAHATHKRVRGTAEDRPCDHCRRVVPRIHADMVQLPPVVVDLPPFPPGCVPPIAVMFGLCPACQHADKDGRL